MSTAIAEKAKTSVRQQLPGYALGLRPYETEVYRDSYPECVKGVWYGCKAFWNAPCDATLPQTYVHY